MPWFPLTECGAPVPSLWDRPTGGILYMAGLGIPAYVV